MTITKTQGAQYEISIDGTPRAYRDLKPLAIEAAERLERKRPHSAVGVNDLESSEMIAVEHKPRLTTLSDAACFFAHFPFGSPALRTAPSTLAEMVSLTIWV
jgi:hypothetical protein